MKSMSEKSPKPQSESVLSRTASFYFIPASLFTLAAIIVCALVFFGQDLNDPHKEEFILEEPALRSYFSPVALSFTDEKKTEALRREKTKTLPLIYRVDPGLNAQIHERIEQFFNALTQGQKNRYDERAQEWESLPFKLPQSSLKELLSEKQLDNVKEQVLAVSSRYLSSGVISSKAYSELLLEGVRKIFIAAEGSPQEQAFEVSAVWTPESAFQDAAQSMGSLGRKQKKLRSISLQILQQALSPNLVLDEERVQSLKKKILSAVSPVEIKIKKNELVVQRGTLVTEEIKNKLDQIHKKLITQKRQVQFLGGALLIFIVYLLSFFYFLICETKIWTSFSRLLLFHTVMILAVFLSKAAVLWPGSSVYLMPTAIAPFLLTLLLNSRVGLWSGLMMTVLSGSLSGYHGDMMLATLLASITATLLAVRVRKRSHFLRAGVGMGSAYFLTILGFQMTQNVAWKDALDVASLGFMNAFFTAIIAFLLLPLLETIFDMVTDITLLELSDLNHPLMKKMMVQAPGTYHHSLIVSALTESACEKIGANALLARVGCYFHDIGKIEQPEFFSENQNYLDTNKHETLSPQDSYKIIADHVTRGIKLAKNYKLKKAIIDFIMEHQGTGVIYYFYKKALDHAKPSEPVRADDYRYAGPKPQSKETAVMLLADSVEAASRSLKDPSPEAIQQLVRKIINDKFIDGQLEECELTLRDLYQIQSNFVRNLAAIFHTRMQYPATEKSPNAPDLFQKNQFFKFRIQP